MMSLFLCDELFELIIIRSLPIYTNLSTIHSEVLKEQRILPAKLLKNNTTQIQLKAH